MSAQSPAGGEGREQDRLLPVANIQRIMRRLLPADEKISKDAKEVLQESLSRRGVRFVPREVDAVAAQVRVRLLRHGRSRGPLRRAVQKSKFHHSAFVLNRRVDLHAIDAMAAR